MVEIKLISGDKSKEWDNYVMSHPGSISWHLFGWSTLVEKHFGTGFYPLAAYDGGSIKGILPLYEKGRQLFSVAYAVAGGICADNEDTENLLLERAISLAKEKGSEKITFKHYKHKIRGKLASDESFYNRELDISRSLGQVWEGFDDLNKKIIGDFDDIYSLEYDSRNIDLYYRFLFNHSRRNGMPCDSKSWIADHVNTNMFHIAFLKKRNEYFAATLVKKYKDTVSFPYSCSPGTGIEHTKYVYLLYWKLMSHLKETGIRIVHSGRIPENNDTNDYRLGWNGEKYKYYYQYYPEDTNAMEFKSKRGMKRKLFNIAWRHMPSFAIGKLGPKIVARFP